MHKGNKKYSNTIAYEKSYLFLHQSSDSGLCMLLGHGLIMGLGLTLHASHLFLLLLFLSPLLCLCPFNLFISLSPVSSSVEIFK